MMCQGQVTDGGQDKEPKQHSVFVSRRAGAGASPAARRLASGWRWRPGAAAQQAGGPTWAEKRAPANSDCPDSELSCNHGLLCGPGSGPGGAGPQYAIQGLIKRARRAVKLLNQ